MSESEISLKKNFSEELKEKYVAKLEAAANKININDAYTKLKESGYESSLDKVSNIDEAIEALEAHVAHMNAILLVMIKSRELRNDVNTIESKLVAPLGHGHDKDIDPDYNNTELGVVKVELP